MPGHTDAHGGPNKPGPGGLEEIQPKVVADPIDRQDCLEVQVLLVALVLLAQPLVLGLSLGVEEDKILYR